MIYKTLEDEDGGSDNDGDVTLPSLICRDTECWW